MCWLADQDNIEFTQPGKRKHAKIMYQSEATTQIGNEVDSDSAQVSIAFTRIEFEMKSESQIPNENEPNVLKF